MNTKSPKSRQPAAPQDEEEVIHQVIGAELDDEEDFGFEDDTTQTSRPAQPGRKSAEEETDARLPGRSLPPIPKFAEESKKPATTKKPARAAEFEPDSPDSFSDDSESHSHFGAIPKDLDMEQDIAWDITERSNLPYVEPRAGYRQRWIRFEDSHGEPDTKRISKMVYRKHWRPRAPESIPENQRLPSKKLKGINESVIMVEGLVLCELPERIAATYERRQRENTERLNIAERENLLNEGRKGNVRVGYENKSEVVQGKVPKFA